MRKNFTLLELILVVFILGLIASSALLVVDDFEDQGRYDETKERLITLRRAIAGPDNLLVGDELVESGYISDTNALPTSVNDLFEDPGVSGWNGPYLSDINGVDFRDGWGFSFDFDDSVDGKLTIKSLGKDNIIDGESFDKDLSIVIKLENDFAFNFKHQKNLNQLNDIVEASESFIRDVGSMPSGISDLTTQGSFIPWQFNASLDYSFGWKGPYIETFGDELLDGWGNSYVESVTDGDLNVTTLGSDNFDDSGYILPDEPNGFQLDRSIKIVDDHFTVATPPLDFRITLVNESSTDLVSKNVRLMVLFPHTNLPATLSTAVASKLTLDAFLADSITSEIVSVGTGDELELSPISFTKTIDYYKIRIFMIDDNALIGVGGLNDIIIGNIKTTHHVDLMGSTSTIELRYTITDK